MFKRKKWQYLILDEAHMIKNWKSLRWQTLLNFNSKRRLLITGVQGRPQHPDTNIILTAITMVYLPTEEEVLHPVMCCLKRST